MTTTTIVAIEVTHMERIGCFWETNHQFSEVQWNKRGNEWSLKMK